MRDRLIELLESFPTFGGGSLKEKWMPEAVERLAQHLLANGVIAPPCKVGDTVWCILPNDYDEAYIAEKFVTAILMRDIGLIIRCGFLHFKELEIGKDLFFTREEAEKELSEREGN
jgi:hypothetical protein